MKLIQVINLLTEELEAKQKRLDDDLARLEHLENPITKALVSDALRALHTEEAEAIVIRAERSLELIDRICTLIDLAADKLKATTNE